VVTERATAHRRIAGDGRLRAVYLVETPLELDQAAEAIAGEQSSGTFVAVPGETAELRARFRAVVESVEPLGEEDAPSLAGARPAADGRYRRGRVTISWPADNVGTNLPTALTTVYGNLGELQELSGIRLLDVELPRALAESCPGPAFGVEGTRALLGIRDRPILGTIVKPSVGLSPEQTAELVETLADAGLDFVKDDELIANPPWSPLERRVREVMRAVDRAAERTGRRPMVAFNITDELDAMKRHHETVVAAGGNCVMVSLNSVGLAGVLALRREASLPIHGHRNGWGMLTRHPLLGMEFAAYQAFWRLAGVDQLHVNGLASKFWEPDDSVVRSIEACLEPLLGDDPVLPVLSSGQWAGQAPETFRRTQTVDLVYLAGGGIMAHPDGPAAGTASIRQAWEAAVAGEPLERYAETHGELAAALAAFGGNRR
jgi:ribulose-bisphosphate carboxylase large chain